MLIERLRAHLGDRELSHIVAEASSRQRRVSARIISPLCRALERAAADGYVPRSSRKLPRRILQFWDQETIPQDVAACMATWRALPGFEHVVFDEARAREFVRTECEARHLEAYDLCNHPAMKSDLFRLAYLHRHGGVYIDADDICEGAGIDHLFDADGLFRLRSASYTRSPAEPPETIYNNNPVFCVANDEIVRTALERATSILLSLGKKEFYNMLVITGPLNLSIAVYFTALDCIASGRELLFHPILGWDDIARKKADLEYRTTTRDWRMAQNEARKKEQR